MLYNLEPCEYLPLIGRLDFRLYFFRRFSLTVILLSPNPAKSFFRLRFEFVLPGMETELAEDTNIHDERFMYHSSSISCQDDSKC